MSLSCPWADLHCHTSFSDGSLTPKELMKLAKAKGLRAISITDHDTVQAYTHILEMATEDRIIVGIGIELSCFFKGTSIHVLGYDFELSSHAIQRLCERSCEMRKNRNRAILSSLNEIGFAIHEKELAEIGEGVIGRLHIARLMVLKGYVSSVREAFSKYLGDGKKCYHTFLQAPTVDDVVSAIHLANGKAFLAHPHLLQRGIIKELLLKFPFDGIEGYYGNLGDFPGLKIAFHNQMLISGGSDFHGTFQLGELSTPICKLGCNGVDKATFEAIFQRPIDTIR